MLHEIISALIVIAILFGITELRKRDYITIPKNKEYILPIRIGGVIGIIISLFIDIF